MGFRVWSLNSLKGVMWGILGDYIGEGYRGC